MDPLRICFIEPDEAVRSEYVRRANRRLDWHAVFRPDYKGLNPAEFDVIVADVNCYNRNDVDRLREQVQEDTLLVLTTTLQEPAAEDLEDETGCDVFVKPGFLFDNLFNYINGKTQRAVGGRI